jgi:uncharacterized protein
MSEVIGSPVPMAPVAPSERIGLIDVLRGMALFGILMANMRGFSAPAHVYFNIGALYHGTADKTVQEFVNLIFQGKFITLFSFLFGLGFAVQMSRARERGSSVWFYPRRLFILLLFGLIHSWFIWWGDILVGYALTGVVMFFLFRNASQKRVAWTGIALFAAALLLNIGFTLRDIYRPQAHSQQQDAKEEAEYQADIQKAIHIFRDGSYPAAVKERFHEWAAINEHLPFLIFGFVLPRFLAGLWVWKSGVVQNISNYLPRIRQVWKYSLMVGLCADAIFGIIHFAIKPHGPSWWSIPLAICGQISLPAIAAFYACSVALLLQSETWRRRLTPFGAVGRTALTNYLLQSLIFTWFFHLTKLFGTAGPAFDVIPAIVLFSIQVPVSVWWLKHYRFGPVEWLWRSLTYGGYQPMRLATAAREAAAGAEA